MFANANITERGRRAAFAKGGDRPNNLDVKNIGWAFTHPYRG